MSLSFYYCKGDGFHAVIEEHSKDKAVEHFIYIMNQMLEPEKGISKKDVLCEPVNIFPHEDNEYSLPENICPACKGKRYVLIGAYHEVCEICHGTGKSSPKYRRGG